MDRTSVRGLAFGLKSVICRNNAHPPLPSRIGKDWHRASQEGAGEKGGIVRQISNSPPRCSRRRFSGPSRQTSRSGRIKDGGGPTHGAACETSPVCLMNSARGVGNVADPILVKGSSDAAESPWWSAQVKVRQSMESLHGTRPLPTNTDKARDRTSPRIAHTCKPLYAFAPNNCKEYLTRILKRGGELVCWRLPRRNEQLYLRYNLRDRRPHGQQFCLGRG